MKNAVKLLWAGLAIYLLTLGTAAAATYTEGVNYIKAKTELPVKAPEGKVEVAEIFWYGCPHCYHTLSNEYKDLGGSYQVMHHTQMIADLVGRGKLRLNGQKLEQATFHDPCYLGRHNGVYDEPREALARAGMVLLEMDRSKSNSFCCGAGGAQMWKEEEHGTQTVSGNRFAEARRTGAKTLAVGCPFCARMMDDANKETGESMQVLDVAEVVVAALA